MREQQALPHGKAEPRFDIDLAYGKVGEALVETVLDWIAHHQVEVKRKRILDLKFYVETHMFKPELDRFEPSGILVTTAKCYAIVFGDSQCTLIVPTESLVELIDDASTRPAEQPRGRLRTRGWLVDLAVLLFREKQRRDRQ